MILKFGIFNYVISPEYLRRHLPESEDTMGATASEPPLATHPELRCVMKIELAGLISYKQAIACDEGSWIFPIKPW